MYVILMFVSPNEFSFNIIYLLNLIFHFFIFFILFFCNPAGSYPGAGCTKAG
jgi:hypothetical protein